MRINISVRIKTIAAMLAVMAAITGIAAATEIRIAKNPNPFNIGGGIIIDESTITITLDNTQTRGTHFLTATTYPDTISLRVCDVAGNSECPGASVDTGWSNEEEPNTTSHTDIYTNSGSKTFYIYVKGTTDGTIFITDNEGDVYDGSAIWATADASANARKPELPTIALPIASVIGLVFFFHYRRQKEE